jgi:Domain of unknown function (DUF4260)
MRGGAVDRRPGNPAAEPEPTATSTALRTSGTVTGVPRRWLRLEAAVLLSGCLISYSATGQPWWLVPATILVPDLLAAGYFGGTRLGAQLYNVAHSTAVPAAVVGLGWWQGRPLVLALGLVWLAHIGADRLLGYGLKYDDNLKHTHLGQLGQPQADRRDGSPGPGPPAIPAGEPETVRTDGQADGAGHPRMGS